MTLKTLKDLDWMDLHDRKGFCNQVVNIEELKTQTIKWLKADVEDLSEILGEELNERDLFIIDKVLTKFNNITKEDLK